MEINTVIQGDCLDVMRTMPDNCIDTIITDPPYGLVFMGKDWDHGIPGVAYWRECLRVAKPGATLMAFGGSRTHHRLACAIEDAGWEIRDCISYFSDGTQAEQSFMASLSEEQLAAYLGLHYPGYQMAWVYGQGIGLGHNVSKGIDKRAGNEREVIGTEKFRDIRNGHGRGYGDGINASARDKPEYLEHPITAPASPLAAKFDGWASRLKPAFEPIIVAMAPMPHSYAVNAEKWGIAGLWIDGGRVPTGDDLGRVSSGIKSIHKNAFDQGARPNNYYKDQEPRLINSGTTARYPSNVIHSNEPGVLAEFDKAGVHSAGKKRLSSEGTHNGKCGMFGLGEPSMRFGDTGTAARFFAACLPDTQPARFVYQAKAGPKERTLSTHPTQKPVSLIKYLARLTKTPDGGTVLDPFCGSGTTALACISEGRDYILIEKEPAYVDICNRRIAEYTGQEIQPKEIEVTKDQTVKQLGLW